MKNTTSNATGYGGSGGGFYGGYALSTSNWYGGAPAGGGGSGYIGNSLLINKHMAGFNVITSDEEETKTFNTSKTSNDPITDSAKIGNGYAKITLVSI